MCHTRDAKAASTMRSVRAVGEGRQFTPHRQMELYRVTVESGAWVANKK